MDGGVPMAMTERRLNGAEVQSLTLGAVTGPQQGFLVLTVICEEER